MADNTTHEIPPGYGSQEEMGAEEDHIQTGTFRLIIAVLVTLVVAVVFTIELVKFEAQSAKLANAEWDGPMAIRMTRADAAKLLTSYEVIDKDAGTYRIPIERAMKLEAEEGGGQ